MEAVNASMNVGIPRYVIPPPSPALLIQITADGKGGGGVRTILPNMRESALKDRMRKLMETDWKSKAGELLELRRHHGGDVSAPFLSLLWNGWVADVGW